MFSSPAPRAIWPALVDQIRFVSPHPHPTCSAVSRALVLVRPLLAQLGRLSFGMICLHPRLGIESC